MIKNNACHRRGPVRASLPPARRRRVWLAGAAACAMLLTSIGVVAPAGAATTTSRARAAASPLQSRADAVVAAGIVGYVARVDDGTRVTTAVAGLADRATGRRLGPDDQFEIGSNTKTFMATLTLQLVAKGKLSLTDTVEQHLPGLVPNGDKITLKMLLQHTSGLSDYTDEAFAETVLADPTRVWTPQELVALATKHQPTFAPGTSWAYSNTNYILVGMILRKVTGTSPADLVQQRIARPLGLHRTYLPTPTAKHTGPGYAHGYLATPDGATFRYTDVSGWALGGWAGTAGAMISTPSELSRFFSALLGGKLLPAAQLTQMRTLVPFPASFGSKGGYGLGLQRVDTPCGPAWGHGGGIFGHVSTALFSADGRRATVTDATTMFDPRTTPNAAVDKAITAAIAADQTAVCQMFGKPLPATPTPTN
jgi:D-alanyl-D-alanine carboxypeptidase